MELQHIQYQLVNVQPTFYIFSPLCRTLTKKKLLLIISPAQWLSNHNATVESIGI